MSLSEETRQAWVAFLGNSENHAHVERRGDLSASQIDAHVEAYLQSAIETSSRVIQNLPGHKPRRILEVGSSAGAICCALQAKFPDAEVFGVEPETQAVNAANLTARDRGLPRPYFILGLGEQLPFPDDSIDLIVCHTVIEHVQDIGLVISEMARVLSEKGAIHLEAPNYVWPYEPHLNVWCIPLLGKSSVKLCAKLQGKGSHLKFLDHLQFVTPTQLEALFTSNDLTWKNLVREKLERAIEGDGSQIKAYGRAASLLSKLKHSGLKKLIVDSLLKTQCYPSVLYAAWKSH